MNDPTHAPKTLGRRRGSLNKGTIKKLAFKVLQNAIQDAPTPIDVKVIAATTLIQSINS